MSLRVTLDIPPLRRLRVDVGAGNGGCVRRAYCLRVDDVPTVEGEDERVEVAPSELREL